MSSEQEEYVIGVVKTDRVGSATEFRVTTRSEWDDMSHEEQDKALVEAMWHSGVVELSVKGE